MVLGARGAKALYESMKAAAMKEGLPCRSCRLGEMQPHQNHGAECLLPPANPFCLFPLTEPNRKSDRAEQRRVESRLGWG